MAERPILLISLFLFQIFLSSFSQTQISAQDNLLLFSDQVADIHDLLPKFGFPKGIIPSAAKSYSISSDGTFELELDRTCYVQFDQLVYFEKKIKGKLSYGSVTDVSGIQTKKLFLWISVTGIDVDFKSDMLEFHAGFLSEKLPATQFEVIPDCLKKTGQESLINSI